MAGTVPSVSTPWAGIAKRRILDVLEQRILEDLVVALHGPRSVGKSKLLRDFADARGVAVVDLDDPAVLEAITNSPGLAVRGSSPVCIDEYQRAPQVLDALKALLNTNGSGAGTAVLTGSTRHDALPRSAQALTGRLHVLTILPLSQGEISGHRENFLERMLTDATGTVAAHPTSTTRRDDYIERVCAGGFPLALRRTGASRDRWFDDYVRLSIERDVLELARIHQRDALRRLLERLAGQTGQVLNVSKAGASLGVRHETVEAHARLLEDLFLVQRLPAWGKTLRARATSSPKIHVVDSGLAARLLRLSPSKLAALDATSLTAFGNLLETFVVNELRKQVSWLDQPVTVGHWRTHDGDEVDFVVEDDDGRVLAVEVKAGDRVPGGQLGALRKLRDALGPRLIAGVALCAGPRSYTAEDRIHVMPVDSLWRPT
jgi:predicted AAA+ superfamily ATPase